MGPSPSHPTSVQPMVVERPRVSDAIGTALRDAYTRDQMLPEEIVKLLRHLNGNGGMRSGF